MIDTVKLLHEIWEDFDGDGSSLPSCCLAGPDGDSCRKMLSPKAHMVHVFEASSHHEAMTVYNKFLGREPYQTDQSSDFEPYPSEWAARQRR